MKITTARVKKELIKMGWGMPINQDHINAVISDTLKVVNKILIEQKNIKISCTGEKNIEYILKDKVIQLMNEMMNDALCKLIKDKLQWRVRQAPNSNNIAEFINEWAKINIK